MCHGTGILLTCVPHEVCEHCGELACKAEQGQTVHSCCSFPTFFVQKSLNEGKDGSSLVGWQAVSRDRAPNLFLCLHSNQ